MRTFLLILAALLNTGAFAATSNLASPVVIWGGGSGLRVANPAGLIDVKAIEGGYNHALALKNDGTVVAWGGTYSGLTTVTGLSGVAAVAAGNNFSLALKQDGTVFAWGSNGSGQATVPPGLSGVVAIAAGAAHSVALKSDGTVVAWGENYSGETTVPAGLSGVIAIAAGAARSVALKNDGTVVAWGASVFGASTVPPGLTNVVAIAAGYLFTMALKGDGTVVAWGSNESGQTTVPAGLTDVVAIAAGNWHAVALRSNGLLVAWGKNNLGQCTIAADLGQVRALAAGSEFTMALQLSPGVEPIRTTEPTQTGVTLNSTIFPKGLASQAYFEYGPDATYGAKTPITNLAAAVEPIGVSQVLSGLVPGTVYHCRVVAANAEGTTRGQDMTFTTPGMYGHALSFDGQTRFLTVKDISLPVPWTATFWVNRQDSPASSAQLLNNSEAALKLEQWENTRKVGVTIFGVDDYSFDYTAPAGVWTHLAFVGRASGIALYANGVPAGTVQATFPLPLARLGNSGDRLRGLVNEMCVWGKELTPEEVRESMTALPVGAMDSLAGYWQFEAVSGGTTPDTSGKGLHATLFNEPTWVTLPPASLSLLDQSLRWNAPRHMLQRAELPGGPWLDLKEAQPPYTWETTGPSGFFRLIMRP